MPLACLFSYGLHGGGYGVGDGREDMSKFINANDNGFIGVGIQYRMSVSRLRSAGYC
jgi:carboxylesterase type B